MKYPGMFVLLAVVGASSELQAQQIRPLPPTPRSPAPRFSYPRTNWSFTGYWANSFHGFGGYPYVPFAPLPVYPWGVPSIELFYQPPPLILSSPVVINQPIVVLPERRTDVWQENAQARMAPRPGGAALERARPAPEKPAPPAAARPRPPEIVPAPKEPKPAAKLAPSRSDRLLSLGKSAFVDGYYGLAERFFAKATEVPPVDPLAYFYLAQAQFARAEYQEAVASIESGLRLMPEWVRCRYRADELYGPHGEEFKEHLARLEDTLARHPMDSHLLVLYGYQLWFSGRKDEARVVFQRAAKTSANPAIIELFLNATIEGTVVRK